MAALMMASLLAHATLELTPDNFDELVVNTQKSTLVKFLAPWVRAIHVSSHVTPT